MFCLLNIEQHAATLLFCRQVLFYSELGIHTLISYPIL